MSKWLKKELFGNFKAELLEDQERRNKSGGNDDGKRWRLQAGSAERPMIYEGRFLPDKDGSPRYKKFFYHMYKRGDSWIYLICPKTFDFEEFCGHCQATKTLWTGSPADKKAAKAFSRKEKYISNFYVTNDPRDSEVPSDIENRAEKLNSGKTKLFEFGVKLESKVRQELLDEKDGIGTAVFDPEDGYDFIIKVKSTKPDANNQVWPDYADSKFARSSNALGDTKAIRAIMDTTVDLNAYLQSQRKSPAEMKEVLEKDMLWSLVKQDWERVYGSDKPKGSSEQSQLPPIEDIEVDDDKFDPDETDDLTESLKGL
jgi:hypothetical protein